MTRPEAWRYLVESWKRLHPGYEVLQEVPNIGSLNAKPCHKDNRDVRVVWLRAQQQLIADMPEDRYPLYLAAGEGTELVRDAMRSRLQEVAP